MSATLIAVRCQVSDFVGLTKPRITLLVLVTAFTAMWLVAGDMLSPELIAPTLLGTGLASAAGWVLNNYTDRAVDKRIARAPNRAFIRAVYHKIFVDSQSNGASSSDGLTSRRYLTLNQQRIQDY